jgi:NDP-sugar pyrophosphorylase family protein
MIEEAMVLCGGYGSRLGEMAENTPKALLSLNGKPIIYHSINLLSRGLGIRKFLLVTGYLGEKIKDYFKDGSGMNVTIAYRDDPPIHEKGCSSDKSKTQALIEASKYIEGEWFWLFSGDHIFSREFANYANSMNSPCSSEVAMVFFKRRDAGRNRIVVDDFGYFLKFDKEEGVVGSKTMSAVSKDALARIDFYPDSMNDLLSALATVGKVRVFFHGFWEMNNNTTKDMQESEKWLFEHPEY